MGSQHKKKKKTPDVNIVIADIQDNLDQQATKAAIQPTFEGTSYMYALRTSIDFVNVTETIDPSQTGGGAPDTTPPAVVTGLIATAASDTVINLNWTAGTDSDLNHYNVYRGTSTGFVVTLGVTVPVGTPTNNSYSDTGRTASTAYYYRVSAVDNSGNIGPLSSEATATTLAPGLFFPDLELHLNSSFADTSPNNFSMFGNNSNGFILPGIFGSAGWKCNYPVVGAPKDYLSPGGQGATKPAALNMDTTTGFSISLWVFPQDISALGLRRIIIENADDNGLNMWSVQVDSSGIVYFFVTKAGIDYKAQVTGLTTGSWQHIAATFNGATNTPIVYRSAVAGTSSVAAIQYPYHDAAGTLNDIHMGYSYLDATNSVYIGYYDEVRYYKARVLTPTQITNLKNTNGP